MPGLTLGRSHGHLVVAEDVCNGHGLASVASVGRSGVCVHITNLVHIHTSALQCQLQRTLWASHVGGRDVVAVAAEAPADDLGNRLCAACQGVLKALDDQCGSATTRNQSVTVLVEWATGLRRLILTGRECLDAVKRTHRFGIHLLCATGDDAVLQTILDEQVGKAQGVAARSAGTRRGQVDAAQVEQRGKVHRHRRVHRLEDRARAACCRILVFVNLAHGLVGGLSHGVVAKEDAHLVLVEELLGDARLLQSLAGGTISILCLLGHELSLIAGNKLLQIGLLNEGRQSRTESHILASLVENNT